jgi:hypothetical protein
VSLPPVLRGPPIRIRTLGGWWVAQCVGVPVFGPGDYRFEAQP